MALLALPLLDVHHDALDISHPPILSPAHLLDALVDVIAHLLLPVCHLGFHLLEDVAFELPKLVSEVGNLFSELVILDMGGRRVVNLGVKGVDAGGKAVKEVRPRADTSGEHEKDGAEPGNGVTQEDVDEFCTNQWRDEGDTEED